MFILSHELWPSDCGGPLVLRSSWRSVGTACEDLGSFNLAYGSPCDLFGDLLALFTSILTTFWRMGPVLIWRMGPVIGWNQIFFLYRWSMAACPRWSSSFGRLQYASGAQEPKLWCFGHRTRFKILIKPCLANLVAIHTSIIPATILTAPMALHTTIIPIWVFRVNQEDRPRIPSNWPSTAWSPHLSSTASPSAAWFPGAGPPSRQ